MHYIEHVMTKYCVPDDIIMDQDSVFKVKVKVNLT